MERQDGKNPAGSGKNLLGGVGGGFEESFEESWMRTLRNHLRWFHASWLTVDDVGGRLMTPRDVGGRSPMFVDARRCLAGILSAGPLQLVFLFVCLFFFFLIKCMKIIDQMFVKMRLGF